MEHAACDLLTTRWWAQAYGLLALGYHSAPDEDRAARVAACERAAIEAGQEEMAGLLGELGRHGKETEAESLRQDFDDLFMVPGAKYTTPYESVYHDGAVEADGRLKTRVYGPSTLAVQSFYQRIGLDIAEGYSELPDYVGLEMACMEYLYAREAECLEAGDEPSARRVRARRLEFCRDHLAQWIPALGRRVRELAETAYYKELAAVTLTAVQQGAGASS